MSYSRSRNRTAVGIAIAVLCGAIFLAAPALPATGAPPATAVSARLTEVTGFGVNPTNLQMYLYVPDTVRVHPSVLVAVHYCTGSGPALFEGTDYASLADRTGLL